jgi:acyl carrier protein
LAPSNSEKVYVPPKSSLQQALAQTWSELLGVEKIGINDDFFELGGHSLIITALVSRLRETFRVKVPVKSLFESPTIEGLSQTILANEAAPGQAEKIARALNKVRAISPQAAEAALQEKRLVRTES